MSGVKSIHFRTSRRRRLTLLTLATTLLHTWLDNRSRQPDSVFYSSNPYDPSVDKITHQDDAGKQFSIAKFSKAISSVSNCHHSGDFNLNIAFGGFRTSSGYNTVRVSDFL